jgi:hypothetical protein
MDDLERTAEESLRTRAIAILKKRRDFRAHLLVYAMMNSAFVAIWAMTTRDSFFWPVLPLVFWGVGVVMNGWDAYFNDDFSEQKIEREMHRLVGPH